MPKDNFNDEATHRKHGLLKDQVQLVKRKDSDRYEIAAIPDNLSFEKGFFAVVRACQLLAQKNEGLIVIGVAGPSGAGKTVFTEKIVNFMPSIAVISMDNYNDASRIIDGNYDGMICSLLSFFFFKFRFSFMLILLVEFSFVFLWSLFFLDWDIRSAFREKQYFLSLLFVIRGCNFELSRCFT